MGLISRRTRSLAAVLHDLRTPLTRLKLRANDVANPELQHAMYGDIAEMEQMIDATLSYLRGEDASEPQRALDLGALLQTIVDDANDAGQNLLLCRTAMLAFSLVGIAGGGNAHEGHDHGAPPPPVSNTIAPRAEASSSDFEVVVIARGGEMLIHLDAFKTNAPVAGAAIEIDTAAGQLMPADRGNGLYAVNASFLTVPGSYDLAITVTVQDTVDILATTIVEGFWNLVGKVCTSTCAAMDWG